MTAIPIGPVTTLPSLTPCTEYSTLTPSNAWLFMAFLVLIVMVLYSLMGLLVVVVVVVLVVVVVVPAFVVVIVVVVGVGVVLGRLSRIHHCKGSSVMRRLILSKAVMGRSPSRTPTSQYLHNN